MYNIILTIVFYYNHKRFYFGEKLDKSIPALSF